jgi:uncharacterized protein YtpQ (UPF0354 family)
VRAGACLIAVLALLAVLAGCDDKGKATTQPLGASGFKNKVAAAIVTSTDLQAEPGVGQTVAVSSTSSLNTLSLPLQKPFADYQARRARLDAIVGKLVAEARSRMASGNSGESFADARSHILPLLKPIGSFRRLTDEPAVTPFPGALRVAYAVQRADSVMIVTNADASRWNVSVSDLHRAALANLLRETNREQPLRCEQKLCGWASGDGYDAARMIVPELRRQIVRKIGPAVYAVPRESVYVALPIKLADRIREKVARDFVTAPNPVSVDLFIERGGELVVLSK